MASTDDECESVWDYPRPPRVEPVSRRLKVMFAGHIIAETVAGFRVLETSHPPTYYFPPSDVDAEALRPARGNSFCEFKGVAEYLTIVARERTSERAAWRYPDPTPAFADIAGFVAFYPSRVDACFVGHHQVVPQDGDFYGGWITPDIRGPFKGGPGTRGW